jgi:hypothetical protein
VKVIVVIATRPVTVKEDSPPKPLPRKEVIVWDDVPSDTTTEIRASSAEK